MYLLSVGTNGCLNRGILMMDRINPSSENNIGTVMKIMTGMMREERRGEGRERGILQVGSVFFNSLFFSLSLSVIHYYNSNYIFSFIAGLGDRGHRDYISHFIDLTTSMQGLDHPNILPLLGLSIEDNCVPIALYPLTEYGNLHFALEMCRLMPDGNPLSVSEEYTRVY